jgi:multidrug resistance efflux pump
MLQQFVRKGDPVAKVYSFHTVKAQIMISEKEITAIKIGQPIQLKARAYPEETFHGKVTFIATSAGSAAAAAEPTLAATAMPTGSAGKSVNDVLVNTEIDNHSLLLKPEMTGRARIDCGRRRLAELIMWHLKRYFRVDFLSW